MSSDRYLPEIQDSHSSEVFASALMRQINKDDVCNMVRTQLEMLGRFEKTNEMLINFNILSASRCAVTSQEFKKHTVLMYDMKKDLDTVFKRIRTLKQRLGKMYPESFKVVEADQDEEDDQFNPDLPRLNQTASGMNRTTSEHSSLSKKKVMQRTSTVDGSPVNRSVDGQGATGRVVSRQAAVEQSKSEDNLARLQSENHPKKS